MIMGSIECCCERMLSLHAHVTRDNTSKSNGKSQLAGRKAKVECDVGRQRGLPCLRSETLWKNEKCLNQYCKTGFHS